MSEIKVEVQLTDRTSHEEFRYCVPVGWVPENVLLGAIFEDGEWQLCYVVEKDEPTGELFARLVVEDQALAKAEEGEVHEVPLSKLAIWPENGPPWSEPVTIIASTTPPPQPRSKLKPEVKASSEADEFTKREAAKAKQYLIATVNIVEVRGGEVVEVKSYSVPTNVLLTAMGSVVSAVSAAFAIFAMSKGFTHENAVVASDNQTTYYANGDHKLFLVPSKSE